MCFIVKDPEEAVKGYLEAQDTTGISEVMGVQRLRKEYSTHEGRRELLNMYDLFLVDNRVSPMMPGLLGNAFLDAKKMPLQVDMRKNVVKGIEKAISSTALNLRQGTSTTVRVGRTDFTVDQVVDNLVMAVDGVVRRLPGGWRDIQSLNIKSNKSPALPIFLALPTASMPYVKPSKSEDDSENLIPETSATVVPVHEDVETEAITAKTKSKKTKKKLKSPGKSHDNTVNYSTREKYVEGRAESEEGPDGVKSRDDEDDVNGGAKLREHTERETEDHSDSEANASADEDPTRNVVANTPKQKTKKSSSDIAPTLTRRSTRATKKSKLPGDEASEVESTPSSKSGKAASMKRSTKKVKNADARSEQTELDVDMRENSRQGDEGGGSSSANAGAKRPPTGKRKKGALDAESVPSAKTEDAGATPVVTRRTRPGSAASTNAVGQQSKSSRKRGATEEGDQPEVSSTRRSTRKRVASSRLVDGETTLATADAKVSKTLSVRKGRSAKK